MERSEKAKKQREMKKYGKKVLEVVPLKESSFTVAIFNTYMKYFQVVLYRGGMGIELNYKIGK